MALGKQKTVFAFRLVLYGTNEKSLWFLHQRLFFYVLLYHYFYNFLIGRLHTDSADMTYRAYRVGGVAL